MTRVTTAQPRRFGSERDGTRPPRTVRSKPYVVMILVLIALAVIMMGVKDGTYAAVMTAFLGVATTATAVGVWGTALAVKDTELGSRPDD